MFYDKCKRKELYESYFYYGFEDRDKILEAIIFFTNHNLNIKKSLENIYEFSPEESIEKLEEEASKIYLQFYRFINMNDKDAVDSNGYYKLTQKKRKKFIECGEIQEKDVRPVIEKKIEEFMQEKKIMKTKAGVYFNRQQEAYYYRPYYTEKYENPDNAWWTEEVYNFLSDLKELERSDKIEYYKEWLETKLQRAINCNYNQKDIETIEFVNTRFKGKLKEYREELKEKNIDRELS